MTWMVKASGVVTGLVSCTRDLDYGPVKFQPPTDVDHQAGFRVVLTCTDRADADSTLKRLPGAITCMILLGYGAWVTVDVRDWAIEGPEGQLSTETSMPNRGRLVADLGSPDHNWDPADLFRRYVALEDEILAEQLTLFQLGLQGTQTTAHPAVGLWAFTRLIEEAHPKGKQSLEHALDMAHELRDRGYQIPADPPHKPPRIRAAAVHRTRSNERLPGWEAVPWFVAVARAYIDTLMRSKAQATDRDSVAPEANTDGAHEDGAS